MTVSPPFNVNESVPADNGVASQFPAAERTFRDTVESWLLINHNVNGRHDEVQYDWKADPASGTASVTEVWADSSANGALLVRHGTGDTEFVGVPSGSVLAFAATTAPNGWLLCYGQAISRTTYARLFAVISTTFGTGDGSTTFNLPDLRGRVIAGQDDMGGTSANRLTGLTDGINGDTFAAAGGLESCILTTAQMPTHTHTVTDPGHTHNIQNIQSPSVAIGNGTVAGVRANNVGYLTDSATTGITLGNAGSDAAHNNVQPTLILNYIIKT